MSKFEKIADHPDGRLFRRTEQAKDGGFETVAAGAGGSLSRRPDPQIGGFKTMARGISGSISTRRREANNDGN